MEEKSKSKIKREMHTLQNLGEELVGLSPSVIDQLGLPEELCEAVLFAKNIKKPEARRRQLQYIGVLMRELDPEPIRASLASISGRHRAKVNAFHQIEAWRDQLIEGNDALVEELLKRFPEADPQRIHQLVRNARREKRDSKLPKSARALFRYLAELAEATSAWSQSG
jgi:ribosome-associated protein